MNSLILKTGAQVLLPALLVLSIVILFQGHNEPGGGFVGGLVAAAAFALYSFAWGPEATRRLLGVDLHVIFGTGLLLAILSGVFGFFFADAFLQGLWHEFNIAALGPVKISNIVFFDIGVFLTVVGAILTLVLTLEEN